MKELRSSLLSFQDKASPPCLKNLILIRPQRPQCYKCALACRTRGRNLCCYKVSIQYTHLNRLRTRFNAIIFCWLSFAELTESCLLFCSNSPNELRNLPSPWALSPGLAYLSKSFSSGIFSFFSFFFLEKQNK